MLNSISNYLGFASCVTDFADDVVGIFKNANNATNTTFSKTKRTEACEDFIENLVNVAVPIAAGVVAGVFSYSAAAIPAAIAAQAFVKKANIGKMAGKLLAPIVEPVMNFFGSLKDKIKSAIGFDLGKWVGMGVAVAEPVVKVSKSIVQSPVLAKMVKHQDKPSTTMNRRQRPMLLSGKTKATKRSYFTRAKAAPRYAYRARKGF